MLTGKQRKNFWILLSRPFLSSWVQTKKKRCPNKLSSTESPTKHQRIPTLVKMGKLLYLRQWIIKTSLLLTKSGQFPSLIGSANHKGTCLTSSSSMFFGGFSESGSFMAILWNTSETSSMFLLQLSLSFSSVFFYFIPPLIFIILK